MPKIKDFMPAVKGIAGIFNPVAPILIGAAESALSATKKTTQRTSEMLNGKKTYIGIAVAAAPLVAKLFGYEVAPGFDAEATEVLTQLVSAVGLLIAAFGRAKAELPGKFAKKK